MQCAAHLLKSSARTLSFVLTDSVRQENSAEADASIGFARVGDTCSNMPCPLGRICGEACSMSRVTVEINEQCDWIAMAELVKSCRKRISRACAAQQRSSENINTSSLPIL